MADPAQVLPILPDYSFSSPVVSVPDSNQWYPVCRIMARGKRVILRGNVGGGGALTHLRLTRAVIQDDAHMEMFTDGDFLNADEDLLDVIIDSSFPVYQTQAGASFQMSIDATGAEYAIYAQGSATTLQISGSCYPQSIACM